MARSDEAFPVAGAADPGTDAPDGGYGLQGFFGAVRRSLPMLILWLVVCWLCAAILLIRSPIEYTASTQVALQSMPKKKSALDREGAFVTLDAAQAESRIQAVHGERLLRSVFDTLQLKDSPDYRAAGPSLLSGLLQRLLLPFHGAGAATDKGDETASLLAFMGKVNAHRVGLSYVMEISFQAPTPEKATSIANSITSAYIRDRVLASDKDEQFLERRIADIKRQMDILSASILKGVIPDGEFPDADARVIGAAIMPLAKSSPKTGLTLAFATVFSMLTGLAVVFFRHNRDRVLRDPAQVQAAAGVACVAVLRTGDAARLNAPPSRRPGAAAGGMASQGIAMRRLLWRLADPSTGGNRAAVGLVACASGSGTTVASLSLASCLASNGQSVALVDANLGKPDLTAALAPATTGLTDLLRTEGATEVGEHLQSVGRFAFLSRGRASLPDEGWTHPTRTQALIERIRTSATVVVDLPSLDASNVALSLSAALDGAYLVVEAGKTTVDELRDGVALLRHCGVACFGVIMNAMPGRGAARWKRSAPVVARRPADAGVSV